METYIIIVLSITLGLWICISWVLCAIAILYTVYLRCCLNITVDTPVAIPFAYYFLRIMPVLLVCTSLLCMAGLWPIGILVFCVVKCICWKKMVREMM